MPKIIKKTFLFTTAIVVGTSPALAKVSCRDIFDEPNEHQYRVPEIGYSPVQTYGINPSFSQIIAHQNSFYVTYVNQERQIIRIEKFPRRYAAPLPQIYNH